MNLLLVLNYLIQLKIHKQNFVNRDQGRHDFKQN